MAADKIVAAIDLAVTSTVTLPDGYNPNADESNRRVEVRGELSVSTVVRSDGTTTPQVTTLVKDVITIGGGGTETIDLSAARVVGAVDGNGDPAATEDLTGSDKRLFLYVFKTIREDGVTNAGAITVRPAAVNGYDLFGAAIADGTIMQAEDYLARYVQSNTLETVETTAQDIEVVGTTGDKIEYSLYFTG